MIEYKCIKEAGYLVDSIDLQSSFSVQTGKEQDPILFDECIKKSERKRKKKKMKEKFSAGFF